MKRKCVLSWNQVKAYVKILNCKDKLTVTSTLKRYKQCGTIKKFLLININKIGIINKYGTLIFT